MTTHRSWRRVHFQSNGSFERKQRRTGKCIKNKVQTLLFCLYKGTSLFIPKTFLLEKNKTKRKIAFRRPVHQQAQRKRFQSNGTRDTDNIENKDGIKHCGKKINDIMGRRDEMREAVHVREGGTQLCGLYSNSRASVEEIPLNQQTRPTPVWYSKCFVILTPDR